MDHWPESAERAWELFLRVLPTSVAMSQGLIDPIGQNALAEWCFAAVDSFDRIADLERDLHDDDDDHHVLS